MWGLVPCPPEFVAEIGQRVTGADQYDQFLFMTQDAGLIATGAKHVGATLEAACESVELALTAPPGFTRLSRHRFSAYSINHRPYSSTVLKAPENPLREFLCKTVTPEGEPTLNAESKATPTIHVIGVYPKPYASPETDRLTILAEAKARAKIGGVLCDGLQPMSGERRLEPVSEDFIAELVLPFGQLVTFDPKRAQRLRRRRANVRTVGKLRYRYTVFACMVKIIGIYRKRCWRGPIAMLSCGGWERYSIRGLGCASRVIMEYVQLSKMLGNQKSCLRIATPWLRQMYFQRNRFKANVNADFLKWYDRTMKKAGIPTDQAKYQLREKKSG